MNRRTFTKTALSLPLLGALPTISRGDFDSEAERIAEYILRRKVGIKHSRGVRQGKSEITSDVTGYVFEFDVKNQLKYRTYHYQIYGYENINSGKCIYLSCITFPENSIRFNNIHKYLQESFISLPEEKSIIMSDLPILLFFW